MVSCIEIAEKVINGEIPDPTLLGGEIGATFYYNPAIASPSWGRSENYTRKGYQRIKIQDHLFFTPNNINSPIL